MRGLCSVLTAVAAAMSAGCEERVRECGGGVEIVIALPDVDALPNAAAMMWVILDVNGVPYQREFDAGALGGGETSFTLDLDNAEPVNLHVTVEIAYDGPGFYDDVIWLRGESALEVPVASSGCLPMRVELATAADRDGDRVPDVADSCADLANPMQDDFDEDRIGDVCDGCPQSSNPQQEDTDGDDVQDACDVCPGVANQAMTDEDGDGIPNVCDPCPHLAGDRADEDSDGVGDACDPRRSEPGDRIVAFYDFSSTAQLADFTQFGAGTVSIDNGQLLIQTSTDKAVVISRTLSTSGAVWTRVHQSNMTTEFPWGAGVMAWSDPSSSSPDPAGTICLSRQNSVFADEWPTITSPVQPTMHDPDAVVRYRFFDEGSIDPIVAIGTCQSEEATIPHDRQWSGENVYPGFGLVAIDAIGRFDYLLIVDSP